MKFNPNLIPGIINPSAPTLLRPQSGIDKIMIYLNPYYIDYVRANSAVNLHPGKCYDIFPGNNMLCIREIHNHFYLIINQEFLSTKENYLTQVLMAIQILAEDGFFKIKDKLPGWQYIYFIGHITEIEFYFDNRTADLYTADGRVFNDVEEAKSNNGLYACRTTAYSVDYKKGEHPSSVKVYSKYEQAKNKNTRKSDGTVTRPDIVNAERQHPYKQRLEFTVPWNVYSNYMVLKNLNGTYEQIIENWLELLAVKHNLYVKNNIIYEYGSNIMYDKVVNEADNVNESRFTNTEHRLKCVKKRTNKKDMSEEYGCSETYENSSNSTMETA